MKFMRFLMLASASTVALSACTQPTSNLNVGPDYQAILSTRPQSAADTVAVIKLKEKPLLTALVVKDGKKQIDPELAAAVKAEQDALIAKLAEISPKIQVLYRYRLVVNGLAIVAPLDTLSAIRQLGNVAYVETQTSFHRPVIAANADSIVQAIARTSTQFIGADQAHARGIRGQGMKIGIIDTGIDYTHAMFGGAGTEDAFKAVDPSKETTLFPSAKVVGGIDLVGTEYNSDSANFALRTPKVDANPIDEGGHGTHVAGTAAGVGDGINTYDGVAPDASLYAIKVFGADGSTGDAVVVAALEYSADPNADLALEDSLDVVNLSLGSSYGSPRILYTEAMQNLSRSGTMVVASGGNSGDNEYIVGAPGVADEALSVAASVDDMDQNWKFRAVRFVTPSQAELLVEAIESTIAKPLSEIGDVTGPLVHIGLADTDLSEEVKAKVKGNVAFIDRGGVTFAEKIRRAQEAGAIGVVVANNQPGEPLAMGGDGKFDIPAIMIKKDLGDKLKAEMTAGPVTIAFKTDAKIEKPELIDTITGFSSKGPRSQDALLKPEISAPGSLIISAAMGGGAKGTQMSGTSMAAPHMAGVMALVKQVRPGLSSAELKSLVMSTSKTVVAPDKSVYPLSRQGAGRVQVIPALEQKIVSLPAAISLGEVVVESRKMIRRSVTLKNITQDALTYDVAFEASEGLKVTNAPATLALAAGESKTLTLDFLVTAPTTAVRELDGLLKLVSGGKEAMRIPVLAIAEKVAQIQATKLVVRSTSAADAQGAPAELTLRNVGVNDGDAYLFNHVGRGARKEDKHHDPYMERGCDLQEAGYRVIQRNGAPVMQFAVKLFEPLTTWDNCEVAILIDADRDGLAEQELAGVKQDHLKGLTATKFASILLDATKTRALRKQFELDTQAKKEGVSEDYTSAIVALEPMFAPQFSTVAIVEAPLAALKLGPNGELAVRIATSYQEMSSIEPDDFLVKDAKLWTQLSVGQQGAGYIDLPEKVSLKSGETKTVGFTKGAGAEKLLVLAPANAPVIGGLKRDKQAVIVKPNFEIELASGN